MSNDDNDNDDHVHEEGESKPELNEANENFDDFDDSKDPIELDIKKRFEELDELDQKMSELPEKSRNPQDYQNLLLINKRQYKIMRDLASFMKKKIRKNSQELNSQLIKIKETYNQQFSEYKWFQKKQETLQDKAPI